MRRRGRQVERAGQSGREQLISQQLVIWHPALPRTMENPQLLPRKFSTGLDQRVQSQPGGGESLHVEGPSFALWTRVEPKEWAALVSRAAHKGSGSPRRARPELTLKQLGAGSSSVRHHKGRVTAPCGPILAAGWRAPCRSARLGLEVGGGCALQPAPAWAGGRSR